MQMQMQMRTEHVKVPWSVFAPRCDASLRGAPPQSPWPPSQPSGLCGLGKRVSSLVWIVLRWVWMEAPLSSSPLSPLCLSLVPVVPSPPWQTNPSLPSRRSTSRGAAAFTYAILLLHSTDTPRRKRRLAETNGLPSWRHLCGSALALLTLTLPAPGNLVQIHERNRRHRRWAGVAS